MTSTRHVQDPPYGWVIVAVATLCMAAGFGANLSMSVLIDPLESEFGWSRASISLAYTMVTIGAAVGGLVWGSVSDRIGAKGIGFLGAVVLAATLALVGFQSNLQAIWILYLAMGGIGFACFFTPLIALTGLWFSRRRGLAVGIVTAGGAIGQGIVPFTLRLMISEWGWRDAMLYLGIGYFVILVPVLFLLKPPPAQPASAGANGSPEERLPALPPFVGLSWLGLAGIFCCICMAAPLVHLVSLGIGACLTPTSAAGLLFTLMASGVLGRIFFGSLADRIGGLRAYFLASAGQTALVFWFTQTGDVTLLYSLSAVFGFAFAGVMTCLLLSAQEVSPRRMAGLGVSIVAAAGWAGMGLGGYQAGFFFDQTGTYTLSFANAAVAGVVNLAIVGALIWYRGRLRTATA